MADQESQGASELHHRHQQLEAELAEVMRHPSATCEEISAIKRRKLRIRDAMEGH